MSAQSGPDLPGKFLPHNRNGSNPWWFRIRNDAKLYRSRNTVHTSCVSEPTWHADAITAGVQSCLPRLLVEQGVEEVWNGAIAGVLWYQNRPPPGRGAANAWWAEHSPLRGFQHTLSILSVAYKGKITFYFLQNLACQVPRQFLLKNSSTTSFPFYYIIKETIQSAEFSVHY